MERLTVNEAADKLGVSQGAVRKRIQRGTIPNAKTEDGSVYVFLDADTEHVSRESVPESDEHMTQKTWSTSLKDPDKLDQLKLVYDYVKFHIQLYLATPAVLVLVADGLQVKQDRIFTLGLIGMILVYLAAGIHAGRFMGRHVNDPRQDDFLKRFEQDAFSSGRRFWHHSLYWLGLAIGVGCLALSTARTYLF